MFPQLRLHTGGGAALTVHSSIPYTANPVYQQFAKLVDLLAYARQHQHSAAWIPAILTILARRGGMHA